MYLQKLFSVYFLDLNDYICETSSSCSFSGFTSFVNCIRFTNFTHVELEIKNPCTTDVFSLFSPEISIDSDVCFKFWFDMSVRDRFCIYM